MPAAFYLLLAGFAWLGLIVIWAIIDEQNRMAALRKLKTHQAEHEMPSDDARSGWGKPDVQGEQAA